ncbi:MAG: hypothetical protein RR244_01875 [Oscillospiraceae bacterium]
MLSVNSKFRRPVFSLELPDGTQIKGLLSEHMIKASFPNDDFEHSKAEFELCLRKIALQNN